MRRMSVKGGTVMPKRCPGQDTRFWTADDIFEAPCTACGEPVEFFKDDLQRACPHCGGFAFNPHHDMACAAWCPSAAQCLAQYGIEMPDAKQPASG